MNPAIFREYDIRGEVTKDLNEEIAMLLGKAIGAYIMRRKGGRMALGRDCRLHSDMLHDSLIQGLLSTGVEIYDIGVCPTPLLYFALQYHEVDGGVMITGSHNPPEFNGFKVCVGKTTIYGEEVQNLRKMVEAGDFITGMGGVQFREILQIYQDYIVGQFRAFNKLKVVVDAGNGTAGVVAPQILRRLGCEVIELYCDQDGRFPNHHPDPTVPKNLADLIKRVRETGAHVGIAYDGDADRIGAVDEKGAIIYGDMLLLLFARDILASRPGAVIISEVKSSKRLYDDIAKHGGRGIMWKTGHSLIKSKMHEEKAALAGEMSGHMFFADKYFGYDDAIYASCRLLDIISRAGKPLSELLRDVPPAFSTPEIRVDIPEAVKFKLVERALDSFRADGYNIIDVDGLRLTFPDGWGLLRASNTQPVLVLRFEAETEARMNEIRALVEGRLEKLKKELLG